MSINEFKVYSQNGEDGIIESLLCYVGIKNKFYVEFGVNDGTECNTRYLREDKGFTGVCWDSHYESEDKGVFKHTMTAENINETFKQYNIPDEFDVLSIDTDYNDLWLWKALSDSYKPSIVVIEYNCAFPPPISVTVPYDLNSRWDMSTNFMGASLSALNKVGAKKGYELVYCDNIGINAFFVRKDLLPKSYLAKEESEIYKQGKYGNGINGGHPKHDENRVMEFY